MRVADVLRASDFFEQLSSDELEQLSRELRLMEVRPGDVLFHQGHPADEMVVIVEGWVESTSTGADGHPRMVGQLSDGDTVGEMALFAGETHQATACAITEARVLVLSKESFEHLVAGRPHIMRNVLAAVSRRAARANRRIAAQGTPEFVGDASGRVYAVFSPRGGSGKTTVAINLAIRLAREEPERVALVDLDLLFGDAALLLGVPQPPTLATFSDTELERLDLRKLASTTVQHESGVRIVVGAGRPEDGERITPGHVAAALAGLRRQFMVTVVDCGSTFLKASVAALEAADRVVLVCTPELTTLRDVRDCQRLLGGAMQSSKNKVLYVLNHRTSATGLSRERFERALDQQIALELPYAGESTARTAFASGSFVHAGGKSPFGRAVDELAAKLGPPGVAPWRVTPTSNGHATGSRPGFLQLLRPSGLKSALGARHGK